MNFLIIKHSELIAMQAELKKSLATVNQEIVRQEKEAELIRMKGLVPTWDKELHASYLEGHHTGVRWTGGPHITSPVEDSRALHGTDMSREEYNARAYLSRLQHGEWMRGWKEGKEYRKEIACDGVRETFGDN